MGNFGQEEVAKKMLSFVFREINPIWEFSQHSALGESCFETVTLARLNLGSGICGSVSGMVSLSKGGMFPL